MLQSNRWLLVPCCLWKQKKVNDTSCPESRPSGVATTTDRVDGFVLGHGKAKDWIMVAFQVSRVSPAPAALPVSLYPGKESPGAGE